MHRGVVFAGLVPALGLGSCALSEPPELLSVNGIHPASASAGDRVTVTGDGFPSGRPARLTFQGDLFRAGGASLTDVRITIPAAPEARNAVSVMLSPELERKFVGSREGAVHTTFRGRVRVEFEPNAAGLTRVSGAAEDVVFDVLPSGGAPVANEEALAEGRATLAFLGASATVGPGGRGVQLTEVNTEGRAAAVGLAAGDLLAELDGVNVLAETDLRVPSGSVSAHLIAERESRRLPPLTIDVRGLAPRRPADLLLPGAAILIACAVLLAPATRLGWIFSWLESLGRARAPRTGRAAFLYPLLSALLPPVVDGRAVGFAAALLLVPIWTAFSVVGLGRSVLGADLDLAVLSLGATVALLVTRFLDGGFGARKGWSLLLAGRSGLQTLSTAGLSLFSVTGAVLASGRFVLSEMVAEQGGAPFRWAGFRNPGLFVLGVTLVLCTIPETDHKRGLLPAEGVDGAITGRSSTARALVRVSEWAFLWTMASLGVLLFWGGTRVPGVSTLTQESGRLWPALGLAIFFVKVSATAVVVGALRRRTERLPTEYVARAFARYLLPLAAAGVVIAAGFAAGVEGADSHALPDLSGIVLFGFCAALPVAAWAAARSAPESAASTVNPWL